MWGWLYRGVLDIADITGLDFDQAHTRHRSPMTPCMDRSETAPHHVGETCLALKGA
ncbi:protein of unknown function [Methylocaldum szegediense]|uniref:Uncharacterized protein n=1 Tax=Methylocaldum szegediense TaxID=73780 RepID=A0ABN8XAC1_9GAMM|nr:protein of unknown function [Methylocaldum szegediense]